MIGQIVGKIIWILNDDEDAAADQAAGSLPKKGKKGLLCCRRLPLIKLLGFEDASCRMPWGGTGRRSKRRRMLPDVAVDLAIRLLMEEVTVRVCEEAPAAAVNAGVIRDGRDGCG
ncbi:hypothetical protein ACLOJK_018677 [Asimina triloba]